MKKSVKTIRKILDIFEPLYPISFIVLIVSLVLWLIGGYSFCKPVCITAGIICVIFQTMDFYLILSRKEEYIIHDTQNNFKKGE